MKTENLETTRTQMRRGVLELCTLSILSEGEAYPSDIIQRLRGAELIVVEGTLYPLLTRLKNSELLDYEWRESRSGPPRKYYYITDKGRAFLQELVETWNQLVQAVNHSIKNNNNTGNE
jgi:PadR family transcriptional regulator PadR